MARFSACIEMLFNDMEPLQRVKAAKECGYEAVEFWHWHRWDLEMMKDAELPVSLALASSMDERLREEFGKAGMYTKQSPALFKELIHESLEVMKPLDLNVLCVGPMMEIEGLSAEEHEANMVECLKAVKPMVDASGIKLAIEPLNPLFDHVGTFLDTSEKAYRIVRAAGEGFGVLFDIYHQQITEGNLINNIKAGIDVIHHFHVADVPGRHEPGTGEINYANVIKTIKELDYKGYIGCEFMPTTNAYEASGYILSL